MFDNKKYSQRRFTPLKVLFMVVMFIGIAAAFSWVVMLLWNAILPDITGVKPLNFWQAAGLLLLAKILIGGFKRGRGPRNHPARKHWKNKWMAMNQEERQEAKERWKEYCKRRDSNRESE